MRFLSPANFERAEAKEDAEDTKPGEASEDGDGDVAMATEGGEEKEAQPDEKAVAPKNKAGFTRLTDEELEVIKKGDVEYAITMMEQGLKKMKPNMRAIAEFKKKEREYLARVAQLEDITSQRAKARAVYDGLRKKRLDMFMEVALD